MELNPTHSWTKKSMFKKRIHGFCCYILTAFFSLYDPITVDYILYKELKGQFNSE